MSEEKLEPVELLLESAAGARRERDASGSILPSAAWFDLAPADRGRLFDLQMESRAWERLVSEQGVSGTAAEVLRKVKGIGQFERP